MADTIRQDNEFGEHRVNISAHTPEVKLFEAQPAKILAIGTDERRSRNYRSIGLFVSRIRKSVRRARAETRSRIELSDDQSRIAQDYMWLDNPTKFRSP